MVFAINREDDWNLVPFGTDNATDDNKFYLESPYGEIKPRLMSYYPNPKDKSAIISSMREYDGYQKVNQTVWTIEEIPLN